MNLSSGAHKTLVESSYTGTRITTCGIDSGGLPAVSLDHGTAFFDIIRRSAPELGVYYSSSQDLK